MIWSNCRLEIEIRARSPEGRMWTRCRPARRTGSWSAHRGFDWWSVFCVLVSVNRTGLLENLKLNMFGCWNAELRQENYFLTSAFSFTLHRSYGLTLIGKSRKLYKSYESLWQIEESRFDFIIFELGNGTKSSLSSVLHNRLWARNQKQCPDCHWWVVTWQGNTWSLSKPRSHTSNHNFFWRSCAKRRERPRYRGASQLLDGGPALCRGSQSAANCRPSRTVSNPACDNE